jgi:superfamily I DNA/RNA helicase
VGITNDQNSVANTDEHTLTCALPGSGKSFTLIELALRLLNKSPSYSILLITFTDAATKELRHRLFEKLTSFQIARVRVQTFHSVAWHMYKLHNNEKLAIGIDQYFFVERAMREESFGGDHAEAMASIEFYGRQITPKGSDDYNYELYQRYLSILKSAKRVDFNMVCKKVYVSLSQDIIPPVNETHILVDEFQDTDKLQYNWLYEHGIRGKKLIVVGDDDQAIYSWRGAAGYQNMVDFQRDFNSVAYILSECFRCGPKILERAGQLIENNHDRVDKPMVSSAPVEGKAWYTDSGEVGEAETAFKSISNRPSDWAVLARSNLQLDLIETIIKSHGIDYQRLGGKGFWDNPVALMFVKSMYVMIEPKSSQVLAEVLGFLHESEQNIGVIINQINMRRISFGDLSYTSDDQWSNVAKRYHGMWEKWQIPTSNSNEVALRLKMMIDLCSHVRSSKSEQGVIRAVSDILQKMQGSFESNIRYLVERSSVKKKDKQAGEDILTLATMHSSKGLQFNRVWILGGNEGTCPSKATLEGNSAGGVDEERRLFYVAMTRAKSELVVSYSIEKELSRFVTESGLEFVQNTIKQTESDENAS